MTPPRALLLALEDALRSGAATFAHGGEARAALEAPWLQRRMSPDLVDIRSARTLGDKADFFLQRRGDAERVGTPLPLSVRDEWEALPEITHQPIFGSRGPRAWKQINPEHHFAVRVKRRDVLSPELAYKLMQAIYKARQRQFAMHSHGTTKLVNIPLRDMQRLYGVLLPPPKPQRRFRAHLRDARAAGFADLDTRAALQAILRGEG